MNLRNRQGYVHTLEVGGQNTTITEPSLLTMPPPYLRQVPSQPTEVSEEVWKHFYLNQHLREMVYYGVAKTSALYKSMSEPMASEDDRPIIRKPFLAMYQSNTPDITKTPAFQKKVRLTYHEWNPGSTVYDVSDFTGHEFLLVEVLGSYEYNEGIVYALEI
jgi:hypothetical protein